MTDPEVRDALRRLAEGDPDVRLVMPDVPATDETGQHLIGVGVEVSGGRVGNAPIVADPVITLDPTTPEEDDQ